MIPMFEILVIIHMAVSGNRIEFVSDTKYETMEVCRAHIEVSYDQLSKFVLAHMIEKFTVEKSCRAMGRGV